MSSGNTAAWETPRWKSILEGLQKAANESIKAISEVDNPILDPLLLTQTKEFLEKSFPSWLTEDGLDLYRLLEGLARKVIPFTDTHALASDKILKEFLTSEESLKSDEFRLNNIEFLRKLVFCLEEPIDTETSLSDGEFRMLERLVNSFSDRLKFSTARNDLAVREDLILVAFRKQGLSEGSSLPRIFSKVSKFVGLETEKIEFYDNNLGVKRKTNVYKFSEPFETILDKLNLIERGFEGTQEIRYLSNDVPVEYLYSFIQAWRAVNLEPDVLGEYLINGMCNILAYTILVSLPEGQISSNNQIQQSAALLADAVCHPLIIALSQAIAFVIYGDLWYNAIWTSPKKSKYHRSVRYVIVGNIIRIQAGNILLNNNSMTNYIRSYTIRVGQDLGGSG
jgi:hypothetical protein